VGESARQERGEGLTWGRKEGAGARGIPGGWAGQSTVGGLGGSKGTKTVGGAQKWLRLLLEAWGGFWLCFWRCGISGGGA